jgi:hypothetical protein
MNPRQDDILRPLVEEESGAAPSLPRRGHIPIDAACNPLSAASQQAPRTNEPIEELEPEVRQAQAPAPVTTAPNNETRPADATSKRAVSALCQQAEDSQRLPRIHQQIVGECLRQAVAAVDLPGLVKRQSGSQATFVST